MIVLLLSFVAWSWVFTDLGSSLNSNSENSNIENISNPDERIKYIFDFNWRTDFNNLSQEFRENKNYMLSVWEKSLKEFDYLNTDDFRNALDVLESKVNATDNEEVKLNLVMTKVLYEHPPMKILIQDIINLLKNTESINKEFYEKLYQIQISNYDRNVETMKEGLKDYVTEEQYNNFVENIPSMRIEYIETTTNKNMIEKFNN